MSSPSSSNAPRSAAPSATTDAQKATWLATLCSPEPSGSHGGMSAIDTGASTRRPPSMRYCTSMCSDRSMSATKATSIGSRRRTFMPEDAARRRRPRSLYRARGAGTTARLFETVVHDELPTCFGDVTTRQCFEGGVQRIGTSPSTKPVSRVLLQVRALGRRQFVLDHLDERIQREDVVAVGPRHAGHCPRAFHGW